MFGKKLKELRLEYGYTQGSVAEQLGVSQSMIARWEKGECEPTATCILKTAQLFGVSCDYLLGRQDDL